MCVRVCVCVCTCVGVWVREPAAHHVTCDLAHVHALCPSLILPHTQHASITRTHIHAHTHTLHTFAVGVVQRVEEVGRGGSDQVLNVLLQRIDVLLSGARARVCVCVWLCVVVC
jgi:hypothetical protein